MLPRALFAWSAWLLANCAWCAGPASFNVRDFGATGDGATKDTIAFQKALDTCAVSGGGVVIVPAGKYLIGSIQLGFRTMLRLEKDSIISGSPELADYPMMDVRWEGRWQPGHRALIYSANVDHTGITGPGHIEGNAAAAAPQNPRGAVVLEPVNCRDVLWEDFTVTQGGNWATHPTYCTGVVIKNVTIRGHRDGIDVDSCQQVRIEGCDIETGDDAISLKSGRGLDGARIGRPTEDVLITHCSLRCTRFAAIGIGSETSGGVRRVRIENSRLSGRTHAIYLKTRPGRAGVTEDISGDNLEISDGGFLRINLITGGNANTADDPVEGPLGLPSAKNLRFSNIRLANAGAVVEATQISPEKPVEGLSLSHVTGTCTKGITLANITGVELGDIHVTGFEGPVLATRDVQGTGLEGALPWNPAERGVPGTNTGPAALPRQGPADKPWAPGGAPPATGNGAAATHVTLWNGRDLTGWNLFINDPKVDPTGVWSATAGVLHFETKASGYLKTEKTFSNYHLHVEWRWPQDAPANTNSGVLVHVHGPDAIWPLCFECQLKTGNAGQVVGMGLDIPAAPLLNQRKRAPKLAASSEKPLGEWNTYEIFCRGDAIECFVNGVRQNSVEKLPVAAGAIALQLEGFPIEFRHVWLETL